MIRKFLLMLCILSLAGAAFAVQPNLKFASQVKIEPASAQAGQNMEFRIRLKSKDKKTHNVKVIGKIGAQVVYNEIVPVIPKNGSYWCRFNWNAAGGNHTVTFIVDPDGTIPESNEADNQKSKSFSVQMTLTKVTPKPIRVKKPMVTLITDPQMIGPLTMNPALPSSGEFVTFKAKLKINNSNAEKVMVSGAIDGHNQKLFTFENLRAGDEKELVFSWKAVKGAHKASFWIDPAEIFPDANKNNNKVEKSFTVKWKADASQVTQAQPQPMFKEQVFFNTISTNPTAPVVGDKVHAHVGYTAIGDFKHIIVSCGICYPTFYSDDLCYSPSEGYSHKEHDLLKGGSVNNMDFAWIARPGLNKLQCLIRQRDEEDKNKVTELLKKEISFQVPHDCSKNQNHTGNLRFYKAFLPRVEDPNQASASFKFIVHNETAKCYPVMRWKIINTLDGKEIYNGQMIGGGGAQALKGFTVNEITGAFLLRDVDTYGECRKWMDDQEKFKCANLKAIIDYDNSISETKENDNEHFMTLYVPK